MKQVIAVILGSALISLVLCSEKASTDDNDEDGIKLEAHHSVDEELYEHFKEDVGKSVSSDDVEDLLVKIFVVIDYSLYQRWMEIEGGDDVKAEASIRYFYGHLMDGVSKIYSRIDTGPYRYRVAISGLYIAKTLNDSLFTPGKVNSDESLNKMVKWVAQRANDIKNYATVVAFTTHEGSYTGISFIQKACTSAGMAIVRSSSLYPMTHTAAHEIGHSLGSNHDGDKNECHPKEYYMMKRGQNYTNSTKPEIFSSCSINYFTHYINSLNRTLKEKCFKVETTPIDEEVKKYLAELPGQRYTPDQSCQIVRGLKSRYCRTGPQTHLKICQVFSCFEPNGDKCTFLPNERALDGTSCGNKSWCINKQCVQDEKAPVIEDSCVFGDIKTVINFKKKEYLCSDLLKQPELCLQDVFKKYCCKTCPGSKAVQNDSADCDGDESPDCPRYMEQYGPNICMINAEIKAQCCKTCSSV